MSSIKDALKSKATSGSTSLKNPKFYNQEKSLFIQDMATSPDEATRVEVAGNAHVPAGTLKYMIENERNIDVLQTILMNPRTPLKAISKFVSESDLASQFDDDIEVTDYLKNRINANSPVEEA